MQEYPLVAISIINYNDRKFIFKAIESAVGLDYPNLEIIITDNNSTDGTREEIEGKIRFWDEERRIIALKYKHIKCDNRIIYIKNDGNYGFGRPHNEAIRRAKGEFILLLNSDAILAPNYINRALNPFLDDMVASVQGKILRYNFEKKELYKDKTNANLNIIDTTGLRMLKNRRIICIGQGEADRGQYEDKREIFGADGAVPVYRKSALEDVKMEIMENEKIRTSDEKQDKKYEYFDEDFFMYKEDVDLSWRLRLYGWKTVYAPKAVAYHGRGSGDSMAVNYIDIIKERRKISAKAKYFSFKHQRLMQIKNEMPILLARHFGEFAIKEIGAWIYMIFFERFALRVLGDFFRTVPKFLKKRKMVMKSKKVAADEMERWFE